MMDKDLLKRLTNICNYPKIQAKAIWKVGEMTNKGVIIYAGEQFSLYRKIKLANIFGDQGWYVVHDLIWLPSRYGTVEGWMKHRDYDVLKRGIMYIVPQYSNKSFEAPTLIEALIQLWMWTKHGKEWKDGEWVNYQIKE